MSFLLSIPPIVLVAVGGLVGFLVWWLASRRHLARLAALQCPRCGAPYGRSAAVAARRRRRAAIGRYRTWHPGSRIDPEAEWILACPACAATGQFSPQAGKVVGGSA
jgi:hypothetical protein